jgi:hypothetical protein
MANLATLISHGFRNPGPEESQQIMASFHANATFNNRGASQEHATHGAFGEDDDEVLNWVSMGSTGKVFRFIQLNTHDIVRIYNNPDTPNGLRAVPRLEPATCFTSGGQERVDILYTSDGYIVLCTNPGPAENLADTADNRVNNQNKAPPGQHIPRPPNA